jgi:hypothetical protein
MPVASNDVANEALQLVGDNAPQVTGQNPTWDQSPAGLALQRLYGPVVATVQRQWGWDASRSTIALTATGNTPPDPNWSEEYTYPANGIQVWQLLDPSNTDPNNPLPVNWSVGNNQVAGVQTKVIWTNVATALCTYNNNPSEATWDPLFRESVVRLLASELATALEGRPETAQVMLESGGAFETIAEGRPD